MYGHLYTGTHISYVATYLQIIYGVIVQYKII